jgi:hypothetical protein
LALKYPGCKFSRTLKYVLILISLVGFIFSDIVLALPVEPPWIDFRIVNVALTPQVIGVGDLVVFQADVQIVQTNMVMLQWVEVRCLLDENLWDEKYAVIGAEPTQLYTKKPWNATWGTHKVTWIVDPDYEFNDMYRDDNMQYLSFVVGEPTNDFDFSISATPNWRAVTNGQSTSYEINIYMSRPTKEKVSLSLMGPPAGLAYSFSKHSGNSSYLSKLVIVIASELYDLHCLIVEASGMTQSHLVKLELLVKPQPMQKSSIYISVNPASLTLGESVTIYGTVSQLQNGTVALYFIRPDGFTSSEFLKTDKHGVFTYTFKPNAEGVWVLSATWLGDAEYLGSQSESVYAEVKEPLAAPAMKLSGQLQSTPERMLNVIVILLVVLLLVMLLCAGIAQDNSAF